MQVDQVQPRPLLVRSTRRLPACRSDDDTASCMSASSCPAPRQYAAEGGSVSMRQGGQHLLEERVDCCVSPSASVTEAPPGPRAGSPARAGRRLVLLGRRCAEYGRTRQRLPAAPSPQPPRASSSRLLDVEVQPRQADFIDGAVRACLTTVASPRHSHRAGAVPSRREAGPGVRAVLSSEVPTANSTDSDIMPR